LEKTGGEAIERCLVDDDETALADIIATQELSFHRDPGPALERRHQGATRGTAFSSAEAKLEWIK
jgi:hypothetical protein